MRNSSFLASRLYKCLKKICYNKIHWNEQIITTYRRRDVLMYLSYNRLWKKLNEEGITRKRLAEEAAIHPDTLTRMGKNESISSSVIIRICKTLGCDVGDIAHAVRKKNKQEHN